jgi:hypothetical protein
MICLPNLLRYFLAGLRTRGPTAIIRLIVGPSAPDCPSPEIFPMRGSVSGGQSPTTRLFEANFPNN